MNIEISTEYKIMKVGFLACYNVVNHPRKDYFQIDWLELPKLQCKH